MSREKTLYDLHADLLEHLVSVNASKRTMRNSEAYVKTFLKWLDTEHGVRTSGALRRKHGR